MRRLEDISYVYSRMASADSAGLLRVYAAFDSLRARHHMDNERFAKAIVSCIQSIKYMLVLEGDCNAADYADDAFISAFLTHCNQDCCIGGKRFGIQSPIEMLGDLKGDCDTRALLLYAILKHYHYDVAILTSFTYNHALIAVHIPTSYGTGGTNISINGVPYLLWETTSKNFRPGEIPSDIANVAQWTVSLLNSEGQPL